MTEGSTRPLTEMSTRDVSWGVKVAGALPPSRADCLEIWEPQTPEKLRVCPSLYRDRFNFYFERYML